MGVFSSLEHTQTTFNNLIKRIIAVCYLLKKPQKIRNVRKKDKIKVLFVLTELGPWKTEILYLTMLKHPRFEPIIGVALGIVDYPTMEAKKLSGIVVKNKSINDIIKKYIEAKKKENEETKEKEKENE